MGTKNLLSFLFFVLFIPQVKIRMDSGGIILGKQSMKAWLFPRFPPTLGHHMLIRIFFLLEKNNIKFFVSESFTISVRVKLSFPESRKVFLFQALLCKEYVKQMFFYLASPKLIQLIFESLSSGFSVISLLLLT